MKHIETERLAKPILRNRFTDLKVGTICAEKQTGKRWVRTDTGAIYECAGCGNQHTLSTAQIHEWEHALSTTGRSYFGPWLVIEVPVQNEAKLQALEDERNAEAALLFSVAMLMVDEIALLIISAAPETTTGFDTGHHVIDVVADPDEERLLTAEETL